jgi:tetratricopeptide (TPR) repeat protein
MQKVLDKYASRGFAVLSINIIPEEDELVVPLMKGNGYGFLLLKSDYAWATKTYKVRGTPTNFLIDTQGRVMFRPFIYDPVTGKKFERQVEALLSRKNDTRAGQSRGTPAAKAQYEQGQASYQKGDYPKAAEAYRKAIELDPDFLDAHFRFISASMRPDKKHDFDAVTKRLQKLYQGWADKSDKAVYEWALGALSYKTPAKSEDYYRKAIAMDPNFARAYYELAQRVVFRGQNLANLQYLKKAVDIDPENSDYVFDYAVALSKSDPAEARKLFLQIVSRFPNEDKGASALLSLADQTDKLEDKIAIFERLKTEYPPERFLMSAHGMQLLFALYSRSDPAKALALAHQMAKNLPEAQKKTWQTRVTYQQNVIDARKLLTENKFAEALALLEGTPNPSHVPDVATTLMKAEAEDGIGEAAKAFDRIAKIVMDSPSDTLNAALCKYGAQLKKSPLQVDDDVWLIRDQKATAAPDFELPKYGDDRKVRLSDYRGRVVMVNFFFPG